MLSQKIPLTYKDWKNLKDNEKNLEQKLRYENNGKSTISNNQFYNTNTDFRIRTKNYKSMGGSSCSFMSDNIRYRSGQSNFMPSNSFDGSNDSMCRRNSSQPMNNFFNNFRYASNFNSTNNSGDYNACKQFNHPKATNKFTSSNELQNSFRSSYGYGNSNRDYIDYEQSNNFFTSDCVYPQRDMMQKPLPNPFRYGDKDNNLLQQFDKERYTKNYKKTKNKKISKEANISSNNSHETLSADAQNYSREAEVYIANPKALYDDKPYILRPKIPEQKSEQTYEERKQQWKEYRQAMKPFKNRDFHNAKRAVQRLGKKALSELNEKELYRLKNAQEYIGIYKARLNAKFANYVKAEDGCSELGELYVLKTVPLNKSTNFNESTDEQNCDDVSKSLTNNNFDSTSSIGVDNTEFITDDAYKESPVTA